MTRLPRRIRLLLACYPPSFKDRYGDEQRSLLADLGTDGTTVDLATGVVKAWLRPALGGPGPSWPTLRMTSTLSTVWVAWVAAFFGGLAWNRLVNDPPIPATYSDVGGTLNRIVQDAWSVGVGVIALLVTVAFVLVVRQARSSGVAGSLKPLGLFFAYAVSMAVALWVLALIRYTALAREVRSSAVPLGLDGSPLATPPRGWMLVKTAAPSVDLTQRSVMVTYERIYPWYLVAVGIWVLALIPLAVIGARQPILVLRKVRLTAAALRVLTWAAGAPVVTLCVMAISAVWFTVYQGTTSTLDPPGLLLCASIGLAISSLMAAVSYARSVRAMTATTR